VVGVGVEVEVQMTAAEILSDWLRAHGCDGLCTEDCGCGVDDMMPCGSYPGHCVPAKKISCDRDTCDDCGVTCYGQDDHSRYVPMEIAK
jgi:hypothetical protein